MSANNGLTYEKLYESRPLNGDQIRLIMLPPFSSSEGQVSCHLRVVSLGKKPFYVAVSYTWAGEPRDAIVKCDGIDIEVTKNCLEALRRVRFYAPGLVWIDQLCINQKTNVQEKNRQILLMSQIFAKATRVFAWLGPASYNSGNPATFNRQPAEDGTAYMRRVLPGVAEVAEWLVQYSRPGVEVPSRLTQQLAATSQEDLTNRLVRYRPQYETFIDLLRRPYWTRRWIIQEISLNRFVTLLLDITGLEMDVLEFAANEIRQFQSFDFWKDTKFLSDSSLEILHSMRDLVNSTGINIAICETIRNMRSAYAKGLHLVDVVDRVAMSLTTNPRDAIYSIRSLVADRDLPAVDYDLSVGEVYREHTRWLLEHDYADRALNSGRLAGTTNHLLPSWCIDFSPVTSTSLMTGDVPRGYEYKVEEVSMVPNRFPKAAGETTISVHFDLTDRSTIRLSGFILDPISDVLPSPESSGNHATMENLCDYVRAFYSTHTIHPFLLAHSSSLDEYHKHLLRSLQTPHNGMIYTSREYFFLQLAGCLFPEEPGYTTTDSNIRVPDWMSIGTDSIAHAFSILTKFHFGITKKGWPTLLRCDPRVGDVVVIIHGMTRPVLLRPVANTEKWQIIAEAWVLGSMYGAMMDREEARAVREFEIV